MPTTPVQYAHRLAVLGYLLLFLGILFGITALIGGIISHTHLHKTCGTIARSHLVLQLSVFWSIVAPGTAVLLFTGSGAVFWMAVTGATVWFIALTGGAILLSKHQPIPFFK